MIPRAENGGCETAGQPAHVPEWARSNFPVVWPVHPPAPSRPCSDSRDPSAVMTEGCDFPRNDGPGLLRTFLGLVSKDLAAGTGSSHSPTLPMRLAGHGAKCSISASKVFFTNVSNGGQDAPCDSLRL